MYGLLILPSLPETQVLDFSSETFRMQKKLGVPANIDAGVIFDASQFNVLLGSTRAVLCFSRPVTVYDHR